MNATIEYLRDKASAAEIAEHLTRCDADFVPRLSCRVDIQRYAQKIASQAVRFEAWSRGVLVGLLALYCNDPETRIAYITSVSVLREWSSQGVARSLVGQCVEHAKTSGARRIGLDVARDNLRAIALYEGSGFVADTVIGPWITMGLWLESEQ